jgi:hypothetical protein
MRFVRIVVLLNGVGYAATGLWGFVHPRSYYQVLATFPPYNEHLIRDIGVFTLGLGAVLLLALLWRDALLAALVGVGIGTGAHGISHAVDLELGGRAIDPWLIALQSASLFAAAWFRWRHLQRRDRDRADDVVPSS